MYNATKIARACFSTRLILALLAAMSLTLAGCVDSGGSGRSGGGSGSGLFTGSKSATLSWTAPSTRENGDPIGLEEIDGYELHVGKSSGQYEEVIRISDDGRATYTLRNLAAGTYYIAMRAADINGLWSRLSTEVTLEVR